MTRIPRSMPHLNGCQLVAIDVETTGTRAGYHEIIQIGAVALNENIEPDESVRPFYAHVIPLYPARVSTAALRVHGIQLDYLQRYGRHPDSVETDFVKWVEKLDLPVGKQIVPLAHNWAFESSFLRAWLGEEQVSQMFHAHVRDTMSIAIALNDRQFYKGEPALFSRVNLSQMCQHFGIVNDKPHDALADSVAEAKLYKCLMEAHVW